MSATPQPIEDYAAIGDGHTAALVGLDGSVDWLCLPQFDSPACFAALVGEPENGHWAIGPVGEHTVERRYVDDTAVLETTYTTAEGVLRVTDLMPTGDRRADVVRRVEGVSGTVAVRHSWLVRFDYGRVRPWVHRQEVAGQTALVAVAGPDMLVLSGPRIPPPVDGHHEEVLDVTEGDRLDFVLTWVPSHRQVPEPPDVDACLAHTLGEQQAWADDCHYDGPWRPEVVRSLVTLRGLTHVDTGGIVAAVTTSLPEDLGGERNWDYRYCWLRDAALTLEALVGAGRSSIAHHWRGWLLRAIAGDPDDMQIMYTVDGGRHLDEVELPHLSGYADSRPVRIGNGAVQQRQTDVLGEVMCALAKARDVGLDETPDSWALQRVLVEQLAQHLAGPRQRALGDPWPPAPVHPQPGDGLGRLRPRGAGRRAARPRGARGEVARPARRGPRRGPRARVRRGARHLHPALRHRRGRRLAAGAAARRVPPGRRPAGARHDRRGRAGPHARRPAAALPHAVRRRRPAGRRAPVPGVLVLAGLGVRPRRSARRRHRADGAAPGPGQRRGPAQRGVRRRRTAAWSATSRRRSPTSRWSAPRCTWPTPTPPPDATGTPLRSSPI